MDNEIELEKLAEQLREGSKWSWSTTSWDQLPAERKENWREFAKHVMMVMANLPGSEFQSLITKYGGA